MLLSQQIKDSILIEGTFHSNGIVLYSTCMSEELLQRGLVDGGLKIGDYEFYSIGSVTLNQLRKFKIIPNINYGDYDNNKPDAILVDRRNLNKIKVLLVIEYKDIGKFKSKKDIITTIQQCNNLSHVIKAEIGLATDNFSFHWINPKQPNPTNDYLDEYGRKRSYSQVKDEKGNDYIKEFIIDQKNNEKELSKLNPKTKLSLQNLDLIRKFISPTNSKIIPGITIDPTNLAKQIWQDVWSVSGATPEKCLYTFVELFIFKYLSDLNILDEDDKGNKVNFKHIFSLSLEKAFKN